ncbi:MAG: tRNA lysidine(34) synthetase TilS, partial [Planctomycetia bacterium]|nr:tRNA lysidine(34) synthetase TilS [Planctomycetia bacterium]
ANTVKSVNTVGTLNAARTPDGSVNSDFGIAGRNSPPISFVVAHFDHAVRPESSLDAAFVRELAVTSGFSPFIERRSPDHAERNGNSEAALRSERYQFLKHVAERTSADTVWLAHTLDDQIETVLHRILRGTGVRGLAGIPVTRTLSPGVTIFRPLLSVERNSIVTFLKSVGQNWRNDETNALNTFTRNRIRHLLLPELEKKYAPGTRNALKRLAIIASECDDFVHSMTRNLSYGAVRYPSEYPDEIQILRSPLENVHDYLVKELFADVWREAGWAEAGMGYEQWNAMLLMLRERTPRCRMFPGNVRATVRRATLTLRKE